MNQPGGLCLGRWFR